MYLIRFMKNITAVIVTTCTYKGKYMGEQLQSWEQFYLNLYCVLREAAENFSKKILQYSNRNKLKSTGKIRNVQYHITAECRTKN